MHNDEGSDYINANYIPVSIYISDLQNHKQWINRWKSI